GAKRSAACKLGKLRRRVVKRSNADGGALAKWKCTKFRFAKLCGICEDGLEHWLQLTRRGTDDLKHVGSRGLLLQRFGQIDRAMSQFVQQPRVLDGDYGLSCKVLHKLDLRTAKLPHLRSRKNKNADCFTLTQQRYTESATVVASARLIFG